MNQCCCPKCGHCAQAAPPPAYAPFQPWWTLSQPYPNYQQYYGNGTHGYNVQVALNRMQES